MYHSTLGWRVTKKKDDLLLVEEGLCVGDHVEVEGRRRRDQRRVAEPELGCLEHLIKIVAFFFMKR